MRRAFPLPLLAGVLLVWPAPGPAGAQEATGSVEVTVTVAPGGVAAVEERYLLFPAPAALELRALQRACSEIGALRVERSGAEVAGEVLQQGPWLVFRERAAAGAGAGDTLRLSVRYEVRLRGARADVPLVHLAAPIPQRDGEREGTVHVVARGPDASGRAVFPHMTRTAPGEWSARTVAIPSFVRVTAEDGIAPPAACVPPGAPPGGDGGLVWRFLLLVGIMVAWVPLYLAWARRSGGEAG